MRKITISINDLKQKVAVFFGIDVESVVGVRAKNLNKEVYGDNIVIDIKHQNIIDEWITETNEYIYEILNLKENEFIINSEKVDNDTSLEISLMKYEFYSIHKPKILPTRWFNISVDNFKQIVAKFYKVDVEKVILNYEKSVPLSYAVFKDVEHDIFKNITIGEKTINFKQIARVINKNSNIEIEKFHCIGCDAKSFLFIKD